MQLHYSIFKYKSVPLGIIFHEPFIDYRAFKYTNNISHISQLTTEFDLAVIEKLLAGIKEDVEQKDAFDIEEFTRFYLNDFYFEEMQIVCCDDIENMVAYIVQFNLDK